MFCEKSILESSCVAGKKRYLETLLLYCAVPSSNRDESAWLRPLPRLILVSNRHQTNALTAVLLLLRNRERWMPGLRLVFFISPSLRWCRRSRSFSGAAVVCCLGS